MRRYVSIDARTKKGTAFWKAEPVLGETAGYQVRNVRVAFVAALCAVFGFPLSAEAGLTTLYTFSPLGPMVETNSDGVSPGSLVADSAGNLYGVTARGGTFGNGTVFQLSAGGVFTTLHEFGALEPSNDLPTNADGVGPDALVIDGSGNLYGATISGGSNGTGTLFRIAGGQFSVIHTFGPASTAADGWEPFALLLSSDGNLYGVARFGGIGNAGTVFRVSPTNDDFAVLYSFGTTDLDTKVNADGALPIAIAQVSTGDLYGVTAEGGPNGTGTVFHLAPDGTLTTLHAFAPCPNCFYLGTNTEGAIFYANADGAAPSSMLIGRDGYVYGTTSMGGAGGDGTFFRVSPSGTFDLLYMFQGADGGSLAMEGLDGQFFGSGGPQIFSIDTNGQFSSVYSLSAPPSTAAFNDLLQAPGKAVPTFYIAGTIGPSQPSGAILEWTPDSPADPPLGAGPAQSATKGGGGIMGWTELLALLMFTCHGVSRRRTAAMNARNTMSSHPSPPPPPLPFIADVDVAPVPAALCGDGELDVDFVIGLEEDVDEGVPTAGL